MKYTLTPEQVIAMQALNTPGATWVPCWGVAGVEVDTDTMQTEAFSAHLAYLSTLPPQVPVAVTALQARLELIARNKYAEVKAAVSSLSEDAQVTFEYAAEWRRDSALVAQLAAGFGWSGADLDAMFLSASQR